MVKRALTLLTSILIALPLLMPFNIYADESVNTAPFLGVNVQFTEVETEYTSMTMPILNFGYAGTQNTTGSVTGKLACSALSAGECQTWSLQNSNGNSVAGLSFTMNLANLKLTENGVWQFNKAYNYIVDYEFVLDGDYKGYVVLNGETTIYVNGTSFHHSIKQSGISEQTFTISNYSLNKVIDSRFWDIPSESLPFIYKLYQSSSLDINQTFDIRQDYYFNYPIFDIPSNLTIDGQYTGEHYVFIVGINKKVDNMNQFKSYFNVTFDSSSLVQEEKYTRVAKSGDEITICKYEVFGSSVYMTIKSSSEFRMIPIYCGRDEGYYSTEFALRYGLTNKFLDDIDLIANGTVQSNSAASSNDLANEQLKTDSNTLFQQENGFKSDMQSAMQNVNNTFRLQDMGTKFVSSAQWVRTQYEQLTNNTPFASLITFSLITGLALILLGKVYR